MRHLDHPSQHLENTRIQEEYSSQRMGVVLSNVVFWTSHAHCTHELTVPVVPLTKLNRLECAPKTKDKKARENLLEREEFWWD